jgi:hypothetical protein
MGTDADTIESQFRAWVNDRQLEAKARREGMEWILKEVGRPGSTRQRQRFKGRLLPLGPPELPEGYEVYLTRQRKVAYYRPEIQGRAASLAAYDNRDELAAALGPEDRGLADAIYEAIDRTAVEELDW